MAIPLNQDKFGVDGSYVDPRSIPKPEEKIKKCASYSIRIYLAGPIEEAKNLLRRECVSGFCVTIEPTHYIYTGGEETGYVVGIINYARFPRTPAELQEKAMGLAQQLMMSTYQRSCSVECPAETFYIENKAFDHMRRDRT